MRGTVIIMKMRKLAAALAAAFIALMYPAAYARADVVYDPVRDLEFRLGFSPWLIVIVVVLVVATIVLIRIFKKRKK